MGYGGGAEESCGHESALSPGQTSKMQGKLPCLYCARRGRRLDPDGSPEDPRKRRLVDTAAGPKALVLVGSEWIEMEVSKLGRKLLLSSETYIPPRRLCKRSWSFPRARPDLDARVSTSFIDRTPDGYGVGAGYRVQHR